MIQEVYKELMEVMKIRRGPYAGMDIPQFYELVEELFKTVAKPRNRALVASST